MRIVIDLEDKLVLSLAEAASKGNLTIEELIRDRLSEKEDDREHLEDGVIDLKVEELMASAFENFLGDADFESETFTMQKLFEARYGVSAWQQTSDSSRKKIGRRFKAAVDAHLEGLKKVSTQNPGFAIELSGKTPSGAVLYVLKRQPRRLVLDLSDL